MQWKVVCGGTFMRETNTGNVSGYQGWVPVNGAITGIEKTARSHCTH